MSMLTELLPYHPNLILKKLNTLYYTRFEQREYNTEGIDIFEQDWDNLIILDACRNDQFRANNTIPGKIETKVSRGSNTSEFLKANCDGKDLRNTVYVTASPIYYYQRNEINTKFHKVINVWDEEGWHDETKTVLPDTNTEYAIDAYETFPNKRLLVHYIQPHYPFIDADTEFDKKQLHDNAEKDKSFWHELNNGELELSRQRLWNLFEQNLKRTLPHVERLVDELEGRTVVTADHGNMFGERAYPIPTRYYGHPPKLYTDPLVRVPWLVHESGERREITTDVPQMQSNSIDEETVSDRLADLGYVEL